MCPGPSVTAQALALPLPSLGVMAGWGSLQLSPFVELDLYVMTLAPTSWPFV